jgi:Universal stress protein family
MSRATTRTTTRTTVGFSGSGASRRALRWAVQGCAVTGHRLHVVLARGALAGPGELEELLREEALRAPGGGPEVDVTVTTGEPADALPAAAAADGAALVLGCGRRVTSVGAGTGRVLRAVLPRTPVPLVLVGPQAVLTPPRRVLVVSAADEAVAGWVLERGGDLPVRLLTTWWPWSAATPPGEAERRHARGAAAARHEAARARLSAGRGPVRAEVVEGFPGEAVPQRLTVGDLVVVAAGTVAELPVRTLRCPVVLVPPGGRRDLPVEVDRVVDLRDGVREGLREGVPEGLRDGVPEGVPSGLRRR